MTSFRHCVLPEYIQPPWQSFIGNSEEEGVLKAKLFKEKYEPLLE